MQLTNETALPVAWIEAEDDNWGCDEEDCEEGEVGILIDHFVVFIFTQVGIRNENIFKY